MIMKTSLAGYYHLGKYDEYTTTGICIDLFLIRKTINSEENYAVLNKLTKEVKSLNPRFQSADIRGSL